MKTAASNIFQIRDGHLQTLPERSMRSGFRGETLEAALQGMLCEHPELIPGSQLVSDDEEAPRFLLLKREARVGSWSLDNLFIDQFGVPTLVECKLLENRESRREVIGQIIEYAANARAEWSGGLLREVANTSWSSKPNEFDDSLISELGIEDLDGFWNTVNANLEAGSIRLIIAGDHIHTNVQRMIEYLNSEMINTVIFGLEVNWYGPDDDNLVMITRVVGRAQATADMRAAHGLRSEEELRAYFSSLENSDASVVAVSLLDWAFRSELYKPIKSGDPGFNLITSTGKLRIGVYGKGKVWAYMKGRNDEENKTLYQALLDCGLTVKPYEGKDSLTLEKLSPANVDSFTELLLTL